MADNGLKKHTEKYAERRPLYESFSQRLDDLLKVILDNQSFTYHVVESRAKTLDSFLSKMKRPGKSYVDPLTEITDLCGCRIILYYQDDCVKVAGIIKKEFDVIEEELSHQRDSFEADRFGYISSHYVVRLKKDRAKFTEWKPYSGLLAEIQVRTVIQHAWSAVSHAMQYKEETIVPSTLQRRLFRIAGLFELADEEFVGIRGQREELRKVATQAVASGNASVRLSSAAIRESILKFCDKSVLADAAKAGIIVSGNPTFDANYIADIYDLSQRAGISTVAELNDTLSKFDRAFFRRLMPIDPPNKEWNVTSAVFVGSVAMIEACKDFIDVDYLKTRHWDKGFAQRIVDALGKK